MIDWYLSNREPAIMCWDDWSLMDGIWEDLFFLLLFGLFLGAMSGMD